MDGRGCEDYRCVEVETDVVSNTSGSARVKLVSAGPTVCTMLRNGSALGSQPLGLSGCILFQGKHKTHSQVWEGVCVDLKDPSPSQRAPFQVPSLILREFPGGVCLGDEGVVGWHAVRPK